MAAGHLQDVTVTVFTGAWGEQFKDYIPGWWDAVLAMDPLPNEVVIVYGDPDRIGLRDSVPEGVPFPVKRVPWTVVPTVANLWNCAVNHASSDWVVPCPIDDRLTPHALLDIPVADASGAELLVDAIRFKNTGEVWQGTWAPSLMARGMTLPTMAPFKKSLLDRIPDPFPAIYYSDWGFYMRCAKAGIQTYQSNNIRMVYNDSLGVGRESEMDPERKQRADDEAREYAVKIGLAAAR